MLALSAGVAVVLVTTSLCNARPQKASLDRMLESMPMHVSSQNKAQVPSNLLDSNQWKELMAQGKLREVVDSLQSAIGTDKVLRVRTQWGGENQDLGQIRNTINWSAWKGEKSNLNLILDSKVTRNNGKIDMLDPNIGLSFQIKY